MQITTDMVKELREKTGAGVMDCKKVLVEAGGDPRKAADLLRIKGMATLEKKSAREAGQGVIEAYVHFSGRIGVMLELNSETDFVANTSEFRELAHNIALQIAAADARYISSKDLPPGETADPAKVCLLQQKFIKDESKTVHDLIAEAVSKVRENITVRRFVRYEVGK